MSTKTLPRAALAMALMSCNFAGAAMATPIVLAAATFTSKLNELAVLHTYNIASNATGEFAVTVQTPTQTQLLIFTENGTAVGKPIVVPLTTAGGVPSGHADEKDGDVAVVWFLVTGADYYH